MRRSPIELAPEGFAAFSVAQLMRFDSPVLFEVVHAITLTEDALNKLQTTYSNN